MDRLKGAEIVSIGGSDQKITIIAEKEDDILEMQIKVEQGPEVTWFQVTIISVADEIKMLEGQIAALKEKYGLLDQDTDHNPGTP